MKVRLLGTGTSQGVPVIGCECDACLSSDPRDKRLRTSCLISIGDIRINIDIGPDFRQQMLESGGKEIHAVIVTHEHNDHIAGLDDVRPFNFKYQKDMPVYCLPRVADFIRNRFNYIFEKKQYPGVPQVVLREMDGNTPIKIEGIEIIPIHIMHGLLPILGFRIGKFAYLTDVFKIPDSEFKKLEDLDVLVLSALRHQQHYSHLTVAEAIELSQKIGAKKTYFTHFSHLLGPQTTFEADFPENIFAGYDGLEFEVG